MLKEQLSHVVNIKEILFVCRERDTESRGRCRPSSLNAPANAAELFPDALGASKIIIPSDHTVPVLSVGLCRVQDKLNGNHFLIGIAAAVERIANIVHYIRA